MQDPVSTAEVLVAESPISVAAPFAPAFSNAYRRYVLIILTLVYVVNYLDRQVLGILVPPIKAEFHLSNGQIGILSGPVFVVIYVVLGMPLATFADRMNRRNVIAISVAVFSAMTALCGYTVQYWQLLAARFGTGVGEAGTSPAINSVISDLYPPEKRASALAFYSAGTNVGLLVAFACGGWVAEHYGWRRAFLLAGIPGLALAIMILTTVKEPVRGAIERLADKDKASNLFAVAAFLWSQRSFCWLALGIAINAFGGYAAMVFTPLFLTVSHHMTEAQIGLALALLAGVGGALATYLVGVIADRLSRRDIRWSMYVVIIGGCISIPFMPIFYLSTSTALALTAAIVPIAMGISPLGPCYALTQSLVPLRMRAQAAAILLFVLNIVGMGLGPPAIGFVSDWLKPIFGADAVRYSLLITILTAIFGSICYWRESRTLKEDIARVSSM